MLFNSLHYALFLPIVFFSYYLCPPPRRWVLLLLASCYFYMVLIPSYILFLFALIGIDYVAGIYIERASGQRRRMLLVASIVANLAFLGTFKYYNFLCANLELLLPWHFPRLGWMLPLGLSFHTFQSMAYTIEVYRGRWPAERHLGYYATYVMFFPQLVSGPIERPGHLLPQLKAAHRFEYQPVVAGMRLILLGLLKKMVLADNLARYVDEVYNNPLTHQGPQLCLATVLFAFQIYADFSGYIDIARGSAQMLGIRLMRNFDSPYLARSISDFWHRWNISLSTWFRDYVYVPLGRGQTGPRRHYLGMYAVFLLSGLWHGANWTFLAWGFLHGTYMAASLWMRRAGWQPRLPAPLQTLGVFVLVTFAWIFFRANTMSDALYIVAHLPGGWNDLHLSLPYGFNVYLVLTALLLLLEKLRPHLAFERFPMPLRWGCYYSGLLLLVIFGRFDEKPFVYFQF